MISGSYLLDRTAMNLLVAKYVSLVSVPPMFILSSMYRVAGWSIVATVSRSVQPYVLLWKAQNKEGHVHYAAQISTNITCSLAGLIVAGSIPFAGPFIDYWLDRPCFPGNSVLLLVAAAFLIDALFIASVNLLTVLNLHRSLALFLVIKSILLLALGVAFAQLFENPTLGVTAGIFCATLLSNIAMPLLCREAFSSDNKSYFKHFLLRPAAFLAITLLLSAYVATIPNLEIRAAANFIAVAVTALAAWFGVLSRENRQACLQLAARFSNSR